MSDLKYMLEDWKRQNEALIRENERLKFYNNELVGKKVTLEHDLKTLQKERDQIEERHEKVKNQLTMLECIYDIVDDLVDHIDYGIKRGEYRSTSKIHDFQQQLLKRMKPYADLNEIDLPVEIEVEED